MKHSFESRVIEIICLKNKMTVKVNKSKFIDSGFIGFDITVYTYFLITCRFSGTY